MRVDNSCHIIKANPWPWGNFSYLSLGQKRNKKIHQWANVPKSILVNRNQREGGEREEIKGDHRGLSLTVNPHPPPVPLAYPTVVSLWGTARLRQQLSCLVPLIHFNTQWWTHQTPRATQDPHPPLPLPSVVFKGNDEGMKIWKCSSQGSVKEAISIMHMSISYVGENNTFLWCSSAQSSSDSSSAEAYREGRTDWESIKLLRRLTFFF